MRLIDADEILKKEKVIQVKEVGYTHRSIDPLDVIEAPTIEFISTDCVNVNKVIEEACAIWKANDGDTAMQTLIDWLKEYAPRVVAVPRKHGRWNYKPVFPTDTEDSPTYHIGRLVCSVCGASHANALPANFCDNCGAKMDEVENG